MKVLLINGSPHQNGNTATALAEVANQLSKENIDSEIIWIGNKPIRGCIACGQCKEQGLGQCIFDDDICNKISEKFKEKDSLEWTKLMNNYKNIAEEIVINDYIFE